MNRFPSFLCIGTQKSGTTWLNQQLQQHPDIWLPPIKELHFFDHLYCPNNRAWTQWHIQQAAKTLMKGHLAHAQNVDFKYIRYLASLASQPLFTEAWYRMAFHRQTAIGKVLGDITPEYCAIGDDGIAHVKRLLIDVKIIWIIRDPVARSMSQLRMNAERIGFTENATETQWLELAVDPDIANRGDYADYIPRWEQQLSLDNILYIPFGDIVKKPQSVLHKIETFLNVQHWDKYQDLYEKVHPTQCMAIPESVTAFLTEAAQPQYQFLQNHFSEHFNQAL